MNSTRQQGRVRRRISVVRHCSSKRSSRTERSHRTKLAQYKVQTRRVQTTHVHKPVVTCLTSITGNQPITNRPPRFKHLYNHETPTHQPTIATKVTDVDNEVGSSAPGESSTESHSIRSKLTNIWATTLPGECIAMGSQADGLIRGHLGGNRPRRQWIDKATGGSPLVEINHRRSLLQLFSVNVSCLHLHTLRIRRVISTFQVFADRNRGLATGLCFSVKIRPKYQLSKAGKFSYQKFLKINTS